MNPTNRAIPITLGGKQHHLLFDLNTFSAFEEKSGKFFLDFLASIQETLAKVSKDGDSSATQVMSLLRTVKVGDIHKFVWAALHTYDKNDEPVWPYSLAKVGRMIDIDSIPTLLPSLLNATAENFPEAEPAKEEAKTRPTNEAGLTRVNGGTEFGPSDDDILASMTSESEG